MSGQGHILSLANLQRWSMWSLHLLVFMLPFHKKWIPPVIIVAALLILLSTSWQERAALLKARIRWVLLFIGLYLLHLTGMLYSTNMAYGGLDLEIKLSLFIMPPLLLGVSWLDPGKVLQLMQTFLWGLIGAIVVCVVAAVNRFVADGDPANFSYAAFSLFHHPTYFAMYLNLGLAILVHNIFTQKNSVRIWPFLLVGLFIITIWQLSSRAGILNLGALLVFTFLYLIFPRLKWVKSLLLLTATVLVAALVVYNSKTALNRFQTAGEALLKNEAELKESSSAVRVAIWQESVKPMQENWLLGVGTGDVKDVLIAGYQRAGLAKAETKQLNAHNQFIQIQLALGLPALLVLLAMLLLPLWLSLRSGQLIYGLFVFIVGFNLLFESALESQAGVVFYALMNALLLIGLLHPREGNALRIPPYSPSKPD